MASQKMSLEMISSFFCSSPLSLVLSASPVSPAIGAVATRLDMRLHATEMELMITARSASMCPCCSCRNIHVERVSVPTFSDAGRLEGDEASVALEESLAVALACFSFVGLSLPSAPSVFSTKSTSSGDPRKKGVLWCTLFGVTSRARPNPVDAFPPACSATNAIGPASVSKRNRPSGFCEDAVCAHTPPYSNVRCTSATRLPMYRALYGLPFASGPPFFKASTQFFTPTLHPSRFPSLIE
mmetsp:Transcript_10146/g.37601  ORF Transcript_10146/g.37601 Transcript_10146/m.37601 type:complete len:241 (+) Transcript_10146:950-1672(+)